MTWNLSDAKNKLSEVLSRAGTDGPQRIQRRGEEFVVLRAADYEKLAGKRPSFKAWLLNAPTPDDIDLTRTCSPMRELEL